MDYDVIVVGGGHAGCEAASAAARMGAKTALLSFDVNALAKMSCNPAIGGVAKGQLVREIDALGGIMGHIADRSGIHFKMLNASKGPAVRSPRAQSDRDGYSQVMVERLKHTPNLDLLSGEGCQLVVESGKLRGVADRNGNALYGKTVVLTPGTFLGGIMHFGMEQVAGGRIDESPSQILADCMTGLGFNLGRLKTGTPARLEQSSIDLTNLEVQPGDEPPKAFSYHPEVQVQNKIQCYITRTNEKTHEAIVGGLDRSPLYSGKIKGVGPRYCPSIEDKIKKFPDKNSHQVFIEPEGVDCNVVYPNGISTSLPVDVQEKFIQTIPGLENAKILKPGYAVEYFFSNPQDLFPWMESKHLEGLFMAGQLNGTSGYEEAAAQGLMAGINAALKVKGETPFILRRDEAYIGVLVDDLVTKGCEEPYRLFTASAEHRLLLRQDNADFRLMEHGYQLGLNPREWKDEVEGWKRDIAALRLELQKRIVTPTEAVKNIFADLGLGEFSHPAPLEQILRRAPMKAEYIECFGVDAKRYHPRVLEQVEIETKYQGYIERQLKVIEEESKSERRRIPVDFNYDKVNGMRNEAREKFKRVQPATIGQAARIPGIFPADMTVLWVHVLKQQREPDAA
ncbi:MAG: tRNA uridine-5-carboxymethylaminomethyl(34) synthesis enzyme MnmG [Candidatus Hinthialibacter antarcticus]|nr:tRNA uridine-5-carboxymethylaminomethyl(34) synthesis enzyme MnmG [Candidatus Hinthialibacter antarcticus]